MQQLLRACLLVAAFSAFGLGAFAAGIVLRALVACRLVAPARATAWGLRLWMPVAWSVRRIARISVHGDSLPRGALIVSNHRSWVDPMVFPALLPCTFVAKTNALGMPIVSLLRRVLPLVTIDKARFRHVTQMVADLRA